MEKIDIIKIRGKWQEAKDREVLLVDENLAEYAKQTVTDFSGGDDTIESIRLVAEKLNEIIEWINSKKDQLL